MPVRENADIGLLLVMTVSSRSINAVECSIGGLDENFELSKVLYMDLSLVETEFLLA